jgi:putative colanic acid biosynthesis acetyltransferase WcaF
MTPSSTARSLQTPSRGFTAFGPGLEPDQSQRVQDLRAFRLPVNFRGRPAWVVQLWWIVQSTLFRASPQVLYGWRRFLLRLFGCSVGKGVLIRPTAEITYPWKTTIGDYSWIGDDVTLYSLGKINVGANVVVSQRSYLCAATHDMESPSFDICDRPIVIEDEAWLASDVFISPGVRIGRGAVVGARSTVFHDLPPMMVSFGNPAKAIRPRLLREVNPLISH